jgi:hypothetical protein
MVRLRYCRLQNLKLNITHKSYEMAYNCQVNDDGDLPIAKCHTKYTEPHKLDPMPLIRIRMNIKQMYFVVKYGP